MLISEPDDFKRFLNSSPESVVPESERTEKEAYRYQKVSISFLALRRLTLVDQ